MKFPEIKNFTDWGLVDLINKLKEEYTEMYVFSLAYDNCDGHICKNEIVDGFIAETMDFMQMLNTIAYSLEWRLSKPINSNSLDIEPLFECIERRMELLVDNSDNYNVFQHLNDMQDFASSILRKIIVKNEKSEFEVLSKHICKLKSRGLQFEVS